MLMVISLSCFGQSKWFVSLSSSPVLVGAATSIKSQMKEQGYGDESESTFIIWGDGTTQYPTGTSFSFLVRAGKSITERKSLYFVGGIADKAIVEGFDAEGWSDGILGLFAGTYGRHVSVKYTTYQFSAGYMFSFARSRTQLGIGPSVYLFNYNIAYEYMYTGSNLAIVPGATFTSRFPLGKENKRFGLEFVFEGNMAPAVKMKSNHADRFQPGNANMLSCNAGLAFTLRG